MLLASTAVLTLVSGSAMAADMRPAPAPVYTKAPMMAPALTWTGCYVGGNAGGVWAKSDVTWALDSSFSAASHADIDPVSGTSFSKSGFTGGGQIGCNYQTGMFVVGVEGDWNYTGISATRTAVTPTFGDVITETMKSNWLATARGRAGIANGPWLFYATGGVAFANVQFSDTIFFPPTGSTNTASISQTKTGWTAGGGVEWMFAPQWSVKGEYLFANLGSVSSTSVNNVTGSAISHSHNLTESLGRAGINFHF
jgi:outer membrane immunogenic protein